jgi:hypothetical protein
MLKPTNCQAFFVYKEINNVASGDAKVYRALNENALTWNIIKHSLLTTFFVILGIIFDVGDGAFSVHAFLRVCIENIDQFSIEALRERKLRDRDIPPDWLEGYLSKAYVPCEKDFQKLKCETSKHHKEYMKIYRPIRNKVITHKEQQTIENVAEVFGKTSIGQIQEILNFLFQIENLVFQLLFNGTLCKIGEFSFN